MAARGRLKRFLLLVLLFALFLPIGAAIAAEPGAIERDLVVTVQGEERHVGLDEALDAAQRSVGEHRADR